MAHPDLPDLCLVLGFLRQGQKWSQGQLAAAAGVSPKLISEYERGGKTLTRPRLEFLVAFMGLPPERIDATLECLEDNRAASRPSAADDSFARTRQKVEELSSRVSRLTKG